MNLLNLVRLFTIKPTSSASDPVSSEEFLAVQLKQLAALTEIQNTLTPVLQSSLEHAESIAGILKANAMLRARVSNLEAVCVHKLGDSV